MEKRNLLIRAESNRKGANNPNWKCGISTNKTCSDCGKLISKAAKKCRSCSRTGKSWSWSENSKKNIRMEKNSQWKGGRSVTDKGYVRIYLPEHINATGRGYVYEHRLIMEKHLDRYLDRKEIVHHIDGNKQNNKLENLMLFPNQKAHFNFSHFNKQTFICKYCGKNQRSTK